MMLVFVLYSIMVFKPAGTLCLCVCSRLYFVCMCFCCFCTFCLSICYCFYCCRGCSGVGCSLLRGAWQSGGETEETGGSRSTTLLPVFLFLCSCLIVPSFYIVFVFVFVFDCAVLSHCASFLCVFVFSCVLGISTLHVGTIVDNCIGHVPCLMFAFDIAFVFILQLSEDFKSISNLRSLTHGGF